LRTLFSRTATLCLGSWAFLCAPSFGLITNAACRLRVAAFSPSRFESEFRDPRLRHLFDRILAPVLHEGNRFHSPFIQIRGSARQQVLTLQTPQGHYPLFLSDNDQFLYPKYGGLPELTLNGDGHLAGQLVLPSDPARWEVGRLQGLFRSLMRGDPYVHPQQRDPSWPDDRASTLSFPQQSAIDQLLDMESWATGSNFKRGLFMAVGMGKTVVSAHYVERVWKMLHKRKMPGWKKFPHVLFALQNGFVLDRAADTYARELGFSHFEKIYDEQSRVRSISPSTQMLLISRTSYLNRLEMVHRWLREDSDQPVVIVLDEAQHTGKDAGEFAQILADLQTLLADPRYGHRIRVVLLSATLWHRDRHIITDYLQGNLAAPLLTDEALALLRRGWFLPECSRNQYYAGIEQGYLSNLDKLTLVSHLRNGESVSDRLNDVFAGPSQMAFSLRVVKEVADRIREERVPGVTDRGLIYAPSIDQADDYARELSRELGAEVRSLHSGSQDREAIFRWFNTHNGKPKYLVTVDLFNEGIDIPEINLIILLRPYSGNQAGFGVLMHHFGRPDRTWAGKPGFRGIDFTVYSSNLADGLSRISREPLPQHLGGKPPRGALTFNGKEIAAEQITEELQMFPGEATFSLRHPLYDHDIFTTETLPIVADIVRQLGFSTHKTEYLLPQLAVRLAERLPEPQNDAKFLKFLQDRAAWNWQKTDGAMIFGSGLKVPSQNLFRLLSALATRLKMTPQGRDLPVERLHQPDVMADFLHRLLPDRKSLLEIDKVRVFLDPEIGAFAVVAEEADFHGYTDILSNHQSVRDLMVRAARSPVLPQSAIRDQLIYDLQHRWGWTEQDARLASMRRGELPQGPLSPPQIVSLYGRNFQHLYRALYALAYLYQASGGVDIDPEKIHLRSETKKLMQVLFPDVLRSDLKEARLAQFADQKSGGLRVLVERMDILQLTAWQTNYGPRGAVLKLLDRLDVGESAELEREKVRLKKILSAKTYGWEPDDGNRISKDPNCPAAKRAFRALEAVARLYQQTEAGRHFDVSSFYSRLELNSLVDNVTVGFALGDLSTAQWETFKDEEQGALFYMQQTARHLGITEWSQNTAPRELLEHLAQSPLLKSQPVSSPRYFQDPLLWKWTVNDGQRAFVSYAAAVRVYRPLYALARYCQQTQEGRDLRPELIHTRVEMEKLVRLLAPNIARAPLSRQQISRFVDPSTGALSALRERSTLFGVNSFTINFGARELALGILNSVKVTARSSLAQEKGEIKRRQLSLPWTANDGGQILAKAPGASERFFGSIEQSVGLFSRAHPEITIPWDQLLDRAETGKVLDLIAFGIALPEVHEGLLAEWRDPTTGGAVFFQEAAVAAGITRYGNDEGPQRYLRQLFSLGKFGSAESRRFKAWIFDKDLWDWQPNEGTLMQRPHYPAHFRLYRGIYLLAYATQLEYPELNLRLDKIHTRRELARLIRFLQN